MKKRIQIALSLLALSTSVGAVLPVHAQSTRLSRPSTHMQTGGVDYTDEATQQAAPPPGSYQSGTMDSANLRAGAGQNTLRGGALDGGLNQPLAAATDTSNPLQKLQNFLVGNSRQLSSNELANLSNHDIVLLVDKSSSMGEADCLSMDRRWGMISRWDWCREQTTDLAQQTAHVLPHGISVLLFSWSTMIFPHVDLHEISRIFTDNHPDGMTNEGAALGAVLDDYFQRKHSGREKVRPLLVAIVTDGRPSKEKDVRDRIIAATRQLDSPDEIKLTFLMIGQDPKGVAFVQEMDKGLLAQGAKYDIVSCRLFNDLARTGLATAMAESLSEPKDAPGGFMDAMSAMNAMYAGGKHKH